MPAVARPAVRNQILSPNRHRGRLRAIRVVVIHSPESPQTLATAEKVGHWFSRPSTRASAHLGVDPDSVCRSVRSRCEPHKIQVRPDAVPSPRCSGASTPVTSE